MATVFDELLLRGVKKGQIPARTQNAREWYRDAARRTGALQPAKLVKSDPERGRSQIRVGDMYLYHYDPKYKKTLPYYDRFPLTIMVEPAKGGFYGLNLHYLSPGVRARFLDELMKLAPKNMNDTTRLQRMRYKTLTGVRKYKEFEPCFKHYLMEHVKSKMVRVPMTEWEIAIFLPTEEFKKVKAESVWRYSRKQYAR